MDRIGDLAREFGVTLRALRFYEDRGLIHPERSGTTRLYDETQRKRLDVILFCKRIGLSLEDIRTVLALHDDRGDDGPGGGDNEAQRDHLAAIYRQQLDALNARHAETSRTIDELRDRLTRLG